MLDGGVSTGTLAGFGVIALAVIALARYLLLDRSAFGEQKAEIKTLNERVARLEVQYDEQRSAKHIAQNELAKTRLALDIVRRLQSQCTCGALDPLKEILANLAAHGDI